MKKENLPRGVSSETQSPPPAREDIQSKWHNGVRRRSFLKSLGIVGATLLLFLTRSGEAQRLSMRSWPPDTTPYARAKVPEDMTVGTVGAEEAPSGGNVLPPTAKPRGYSLSDMAKATAFFNTGPRTLETYPNMPFQILYVPDNSTSNTFTVSPGTMFYVPIVFTDNAPSQLVGVFPDINIREELLNYFYSPDQLGNNYTQIVVDGEVNSLGSDYVVGVPVPLADGGTQYIMSAAFLSPLSKSTHTVKVRVSFTGKAVGGDFKFSALYTVIVR
jgi:hypothetical protein